jgi:nicotinate-nucleotide pyrophosphorylase (carboxylating)
LPVSRNVVEPDFTGNTYMTMKSIPTLDRIIRLALQEDAPAGDVTTDTLVDKNGRSKAVIFSKEEAVVSGIEIAKRVFQILDTNATVKVLVKDGQKIKKGQAVLKVIGRTRALLTGERVALNFLSYLSAIATKTGHFVSKVKPYKAWILDTRKTTPTLRFLERYAVRCGGGYNHRDNLSEMAMIKDNHLFALGEIKGAVEQLRQKTDVAVEVEVDTLEQLREALKTGADIILLDNMTPAQVGRAVKIRNQINKRILLEASGGIRLTNVRAYAQAGVDRISIGELTHSRQAVDFSMEIIP